MGDVVCGGVEERELWAWGAPVRHEQEPRGFVGEELAGDGEVKGGGIRWP